MDLDLIMPQVVVVVFITNQVVMELEEVVSEVLLIVIRILLVEHLTLDLVEVVEVIVVAPLS